MYTNFVHTSNMETKEVIMTLLKASSNVSENLSQGIKQFRISIQQFNVLRILRGQKGEATNLSTIQERMVNKMSNTTRLIDKLIEKEYVERRICKENRRKIELFITKKGTTLLNEIDPVIDQCQEKILQNLDYKQKDNMIKILKQLNT